MPAVIILKWKILLFTEKNSVADADDLKKSLSAVMADADNLKKSLSAVISDLQNIHVKLENFVNSVLPSGALENNSV